MVETCTLTDSFSSTKPRRSANEMSFCSRTLRLSSCRGRSVRLFGLPPPCVRGERSPVERHRRSIFLTKAGQTPKREAIPEIEPSPARKLGRLAGVNLKNRLSSVEAYPWLHPIAISYNNP